MMIDWSSSILLSSQITFHMLFLEIHLWLYRTDIGLIAAHIACQTVKITPFCWIHGRRRGIMLIALILIRLCPSPYILVVGDFSRWLLHISLIPYTPRQCHPLHNLQIMTHYLFTRSKMMERAPYLGIQDNNINKNCMVWSFAGNKSMEKFLK